MSSDLPTKLAREPLIDVVFEARFASRVALAAVLPGYLFGRLGNVESIDALPAGQIPAQMRAADPNLLFAPLARVVWRDFFILVSDSSVAVACKLPYPGWIKFRSAIEEVMGHVRSCGLTQSLQRYSLKYVDLIESGNAVGQAAKFNWNIRLGNTQVKDQNTVLRVELEQHGHTNSVSFASHANVRLWNGTERAGALLDVDSSNLGAPPAIEKFFDELATLLDAIHDSNKRTFFECLTAQGLAELEPVYE
jgi:uncharacterized protein (TIGR04255 family)